MDFLIAILEMLRSLPIETLLVLLAMATVALAAYVVHVVATVGRRL